MTLGASFTTDSHTLTSGEVGTITSFGDYASLTVRISATTNAKPINVSWVELEVPDASEPTLTIDVSDATTVSESQGHDLGISQSVSDDTTVDETVTLDGVPNPSVQDDTTVSETHYPVIAEPTAAEWGAFVDLPGLEPGDGWDNIYWGGLAGPPVEVGGTYYFYYCGADVADQDNGDDYRSIGLATSDNFLYWQKNENNPIVQYTTTAYVESEEGASNPHVLYDSGTWHMYYAASRYTAPDLVDVDIRYRTSSDGITWTGDSLIWSNAGDEFKPCGITKIGSTYYLYYLGPLTAGKGNLRVISGTDPTSLGNDTLVLSGTWITGFVNDLSDDILSLGLLDTNRDLRWYRIFKATPTTISSQIGSTQTRGSVPLFGMHALRDEPTDWRWRSIELVDGGTFEYRFAPTNSLPELHRVDNIEVGESVTLDIGLEIDVSDAIDVTDTVTDISREGTQFAPDIQDSIAVGESVTVDVSDPQVDVSDAIDVDESVGAIATLFISVSDDIKVDDIFANYDAITVDESVTVTIEGAEPSINVSDDIEIGESVTIGVSDPQIDTSDAVELDDTPTLEMGVEIDTSDAISVDESVTVNITLEIDTSDATEVGESVTVATDALAASTSDSIAVDDSTNVSLVGIGELAISVEDGITIDESVTVATAALEIDTSDAITIDDSPSVSLVGIGELAISTGDTINVGDSASPDLEIHILSEDSTTVDETVALGVQITVETQEGVSTDDSANVSLGEVGALAISVSDNATIDESTTVATDALAIDVSDPTTVDDSANVSLLEVGQIVVSVSDTIHVGDSGTVQMGDLGVDVSDGIDVGDTADASAVMYVSASDGVTISESGGPGPLLLSANVSDGIAVGESVALAGIVYEIDTGDIISLADIVTLSLFLTPLERTYAISGRSRVYAIDGDTRTYPIDDDDRIFAISE